MSQPILTTKLFIPPPRPGLLPRPHLIEKLNKGATYPLTLVSAAAGSGKTTLLSAWSAGSQRPTAWVSLDASDNDPVQFLTYLIAAFQTHRADLGEEALQGLRAAPNAPPTATLVTLINELTELPENTTLILDDCHVITNRPVVELCIFLIDHLPPHIHLILASRINPPLPLARYRARNQLVEIRGQDLRFSVEETATFLTHTMSLNLSPADVQALEERTEGWIAGLQLAALSMQGSPDVSNFVRAFTGSHFYVAEYLVEEILKQQPPDVQAFLLKTSILERLTADLCEAVSEHPGGQAILTSLHQSNVFVIPLDLEGRWFRYHHLFADLLQARLQQALSPADIAALHARAATWYEGQGELPAAIQHALPAGDTARAAALVDRAGQNMVFGEQQDRLGRWLDALPSEIFRSHPRLEIYRLLIDLGRGTLDMFEQTLQEKETLVKSLPPSAENDRLRREAMVSLSLFYAHQNTGRAVKMAQEALDEMPEGNLRQRAILFSIFYRAYGMDGDIAKSAPAYREFMRLAQAAGLWGMAADTTMVRAFDLCQYGRLDEAAAYCRQIIDVGAQRKQKVFYPAGPCYVGLAGVHLERNDLAKAGEYLSRGLELCQQGALYGLYTGYIQHSRLLQAQGKLKEALKVLHELEQNLQRRDFTLTTRQVSIRLALGDTAGASDLVPALLEILDGSTYSQQLPLIAAEAFKLSLARIYLAQGDIEPARQLLNEIQTTVEPGQRFGRLLEIHLLRALVLRTQHPDAFPAAALDHLEQALHLAAKSGIVMLFREEGPPLIPLLNAIAARPSVSPHIRDYARKLLLAIGVSGRPTPPPATVGSLIEPLTPREMEVLLLIAAGESNQAIAEKLIITVRTVKKHAGNIFGKLNVHSRTQAAARAREIGLLHTDR